MDKSGKSLKTSGRRWIWFDDMSSVCSLKENKCCGQGKKTYFLQLVKFFLGMSEISFLETFKLVKSVNELIDIGTVRILFFEKLISRNVVNVEISRGMLST